MNGSRTAPKFAPFIFRVVHNKWAPPADRAKKWPHAIGRKEYKEMVQGRNTSDQRKKKRATTKVESVRRATVHAAWEPSEEEIRERAYLIYQERAGIPGDPVSDWLQAKRNLSEEKRQQN